MGYVIPKSTLEKLEAATSIEERRQVKIEIFESYNRYRAEMRNGIFGFLFGRWLCPPSGDIDLERIK